MRPKQIEIAGAGLSGLVAAINLAREGVEVTVYEREAQIGGSPDYHPSIHSTPMFFDAVEGGAGIDVRPAFREVSHLWAMLAGKRYVYRGGSFFNVERGPRPGSLDVFLYELARAEGVRFQFGAAVSKVEDLPPGSIFATGLYGELLESMPDLPRVRLYGYSSHIEDEGFDGQAFVGMDRFSNDYFYMAGMHGILYGLLFNRGQPLSKGQLALCEEYAAEHLGVEFPWWKEIKGGFILKPTLRFKDRILAGAFAGVIDPCLGFGIYGAHLGGRIAALAALDPARGEREFRRLTRWFNPALLYWSIFTALPLRHSIVNYLVRKRRWVLPFTPFVSAILPGNQGNWIGEALRGAEFLGTARRGERITQMLAEKAAPPPRSEAMEDFFYPEEEEEWDDWRDGEYVAEAV